MEKCYLVFTYGKPSKAEDFIIRKYKTELSALQAYRSLWNMVYFIEQIDEITANRLQALQSNPTKLVNAEELPF